MSLLFVESFDHCTTMAQLLTKWTGQGGNTLTATDIRTGRFGNGLGSGSVSLNGTAYIYKTVSSAQQTVFLGFAWKLVGTFASGGQDLATLTDSETPHVDVRILSDGNLRVTRAGTELGRTTVPITTSIFNYIELKVKIDNSTGTVDLKVNGVNRLSLTGQDTQNTANATCNGFRIGNGSVSWNPASGTGMIYDDIYFSDDQGSVNNNFLGDVRIEAIFPSGAGNSTVWTPSAGSNYQCVDETTPNDDTDYVSSATPGDIDLYAYNNVTPTTANVKGVQTCIRARKDDAGTRTIKPEIRSGGSNFAGTNVNISTSYAYYLEIFETDPNTSSAWTLSNVNAAEFGVNEVA